MVVNCVIYLVALLVVFVLPRRVWNLSLITHSDFSFELSNMLPVFDVICKRVLSFISKQ